MWCISNRSRSFFNQNFYQRDCNFFFASSSVNNDYSALKMICLGVGLLCPSALVCYAPPLRRSIKRWCASDVCLSRTLGLVENREAWEDCSGGSTASVRSPTVCPNWLWPLPTVIQPSLDTPCRHVRPPTSLPTRVLSRISYQWGVPCKQEPGGPFPPSLPTPSTLPSLLFPLPSPFPLPFPSLPLPLEVGPLNPARGSGGAL